MKRELVGPIERPDLWRGIPATDVDGPWVGVRRLIDSDAVPAAPERDLASRARIPAGARLDVLTDATEIHTTLEVDTAGTLDVTLDGRLAHRVRLTPGVERIRLALGPAGSRLVVWLPHDTRVRVGTTELVGGSRSRAPARAPIWVAYGSSITQGRGAAGPSTGWLARASVAAGWDSINLGFDGECHLDPVAARTIAAARPDLVTLCLGVNVHARATFGRDVWARRVADFVGAVRASLPAAEIVVISPLPAPAREGVRNRRGDTLGDLRADVEAVTMLSASSDPRGARLIPGHRLLADDPGLFVDGVHPTDRGHLLIAERLVAGLGLRPGTPLGRGDAGRRSSPGGTQAT